MNEIYENITEVKVQGTTIPRAFAPAEELIITSELGDSPYKAMSQRGVNDAIKGAIVPSIEIDTTIPTDPATATDTKVPSTKSVATRIKELKDLIAALTTRVAALEAKP